MPRLSSEKINEIRQSVDIVHQNDKYLCVLSVIMGEMFLLF